MQCESKVVPLVDLQHYWWLGGQSSVPSTWTQDHFFNPVFSRKRGIQSGNHGNVGVGCLGKTELTCW